MNKIIDLERIPYLIQKENIDICVVSFGGSGSNCLTNFLEKNGYKVKSPIHNKILCHCPQIPNTKKKIIYIYRDLKKAFLSQYRRKPHIWTINQKKMSNNKAVKLSDENLLTLMISQFLRWTYKKQNNILVLKYDDFFTENGRNKIRKFLKNENLKDFPEYVKKNNTEELINNKIKKLFEKHKKSIEYINNF